MNNFWSGWSVLPTNTRQQKQQQQRQRPNNANNDQPSYSTDMMMIEQEGILERSEFSFVSMAVPRPHHNPRCTLEMLDEKDATAAASCTTQPPKTSPPRHQQQYSPPVRTTSSTNAKQNFHVTFSTDLEDYQTSFDYNSGKDRSFGSSTTASSHSHSSYGGGEKDADLDLEIHTSNENDTKNGDKAHDDENESQQPTSNDPTAPTSSSPRRIQQKYQQMMHTIRQRRRWHKHLLRHHDSHNNNLNFCTIFLLVVGLAALVLVLLALVPHIRSDANSHEDVYYDATQDKDLVVRNHDSQLTLEVLALGLMVVLLAGSLCYCGSVAMDTDHDDDMDGDDNAIILSDVRKKHCRSNSSSSSNNNNISATTTKHSDELLPK